MIADGKHSPTYLGDGLYAEFDGYQIRLFASDGDKITNEVFLEPAVFRTLMAYGNEVWREA